MRHTSKNFQRSINFLERFLIILLCLSADVPTSLGAVFFALGDATPFGEAQAVSANGEVVVGRLAVNGTDRGFVWNLATGLTVINQASAANGVSGDGKVVVGESSPGPSGYVEPFYWTSSAGTQLLGGLPGEILDGFTYAAGASFDGSVIVGATRLSSVYKAFRYTPLRGFELLSESMPSVSDNAAAISGDGQVIVGYDSTQRQAFRWTAEIGKVLLGSLGPEEYSEATNVSADGSTIVGYAEGGVSFRWTEENGLEALEPAAVPGSYSINPLFSYALGTTDSGEAIVGSGNGTIAYVWTEARGMESLELVLENRFGLADELAGWRLDEATDISPNGRFIVGKGLNPEGRTAAWLVRLDRPIFAPEPSTALLAALSLAGMLCYHRPRFV
jgi:hypothetical protein